MPEKKLTKILSTRTCFAEGKLIENGKTYAIPAEISAAAAKALVIMGKAVPAIEPEVKPVKPKEPVVKPKATSKGSEK